MFIFTAAVSHVMFPCVLTPCRILSDFSETLVSAIMIQRPPEPNSVIWRMETVFPRNVGTNILRVYEPKISTVDHQAIHFYMSCIVVYDQKM